MKVCFQKGILWCRWIPVIALASLVGCGPVALPERYQAREVPVTNDGELAYQQVEGMNERIAGVMEEIFGGPGEPKMPADAPASLKVSGKSLSESASLYRRHCVHCHGLSAAGNGPTAPFLFPKPRDYRLGLYKFTSTTADAKPTREDLLNTLRIGVVGTSMPAFSLLDEDELHALVDYVIHLSVRGEVEYVVMEVVADEDMDESELLEIAVDEASSEMARWENAGDLVLMPETPEPEFTEASVKRGHELFVSADLQCAACHGYTGRGDGPSAEVNPQTGQPLLDSWSERIAPANLTLGLYRGGRRPVDLYRRIHQGIKGTPMPVLRSAFKNNPEDIWHVVHFVQAIPYMDLDPIVVETTPAASPAEGA